MNCEGDQSLVEVKSKFEHEFRRFSIARSALTFRHLRSQVLETHRLPAREDIVIVYFNPSSRGVVPLTDDASLARAIEGASRLLRLFLHRRSKNGSAEYDSESDGHCSECNSDSDHDVEGRGKGGRAEGRGQQGGDDGGASTARDSTLRTDTAGRGWKTDASDQSGKPSLQDGSSASAGNNSGSDLSERETECRGKETCLEVSLGSGTSDGHSCIGSEQLEAEAGTGGIRVRMAVSTSPQDPGLETTGSRRSGEVSQGDRGEDSQEDRGEDSQGDRVEDSQGVGGEDSQEDRGEDSQGDRGEDSQEDRGKDSQGVGGEGSQWWTRKGERGPSQSEDGCASKGGHGSSLVVNHEQQEPSQLCRELPAHPLFALSATLKPEPVFYSSTNTHSGQKSYTQATLNSSTAMYGKDPVIQNRDTVMRVTADMLPPHPLLASSIVVTTPPSKKTTPPSRDTTIPVQHTTEDKFPYVVEIYDFDVCLKTRDLLAEFRKDYRADEFRLKWVDDTHALGIFASSKQAWLAAGAPYQQFKTRLVWEGTEQSRAMAERLAAEMQPSGHGDVPRPQRTAMVARRMVASALGVRVRVSPEQRQKESRELQQARAEKQAHRAALSVVPG